MKRKCSHNRGSKMVVVVVWYKPEQWERLLGISSDRGNIEEWKMITRALIILAVVAAEFLSTPLVCESFPVTGIMNATRSDQTATLLNNGKILIAGGYYNDGLYNIDSNHYLNTAEIYDPAAGTFTATGNMTSNRSNHTATLLPNGKVLIAGGHYYNTAGDTYVNTAEIYDPLAGTFTATGNMNAIRSDHTATLLPNGKVLVAGGNSTYSGNYANTAEIYDPATGAFTATTGNMAGARAYHTATLLPSGKVLVAGGLYGANASNLAEMYDPATGTFSSTNGNMITARRWHTATLLPNGTVLIAGGSNGNYLNTAEIYDPATGTFTEPTSYMARYYHTATLLPNGKVLFTGGSTGGWSSTADMYDPATATFSRVAGTMTVPRGRHTATLLPDGRVLITGGFYYASGLHYMDTAEMYDPAAGTFSATAGTMVNARRGHSTTLLPSGKVLVAGGYNFSSSGLNTAEIVDPATGTFAATAGTMTAGREAHSATLLPNGTVLIAGGYNSSSGDLNTAEIYNPAAGTFTATMGTMLVAREYPTATLLPDGKVLVTGGRNTGYTVGTAEMYDPATRIFTATTGPMTTAREGHTATLLPNGKVLLAGGYNGSSLKSAETYDPASGTFTATKGNMTVVSVSHTATLLSNGKVLFTGGSYGGSLSVAELYDPASDTFTSTGNMTIGRYYHAATPLSNGKVLVSGGYYSGSDSILNTAEFYDPMTGVFTATAGTMTGGRYAHTATLLADGRVLVTGGSNGNAFLNTAEIFDSGFGYSSGRRPVISGITTASGKLVLSGTGFRGDSEGSSGTANGSSSGIPIVKLQRVEGGEVQIVSPDPAVNWSSTSFTASSLGSLVSGHYLAVIIAGGIPSNAKIIAPLVNGACGSSNGGTFTSAPTANLCSTSTPSSVSGSGPWSWTCAGLNGGATASCSADIQTYQLTAYATGSGTGNVASNAGGISFSYPLATIDVATLIHGTAVTLTATADVGSTVAWSGNCNATGGTSSAATCSIVVAEAKSVTATFDCSMQHVKNANTSAYYDTIQSGYDAAGSNHAVLMHAVSFTGDLALDNPNSVDLKGGFDCNYGTNTGAFTTVAGTATLTGGTVTVENIVVR
ncbi:MAG: hypothetical protein HXX11_12280 [Desulfuromonadales bacterium]|nr:hypothetical protein [Desulfuromonadales bacterium]